MDWIASDALNSLRSILGDGPADKWEFKVNVFPTPDGVTTRFFVGQTRLVEDTLTVYHRGVEVSPSGTPNWATGEFDLMPAVSGEVQTSFYYQHFTDEELAEFLDDAAQQLSLYEEATSGFVTLLAAGASSLSVSITRGIRPGLLQLAAANAYMRKAAETADSLQAGAPAGYSIDTTKRHPNWANLAKLAAESAKAKIDLYLSNPLSSQRVRMAFVSFRLSRYQGS